MDIFAYTKSENTRPEPFKARFLARSENIRAIVMNDAELAIKELGVYDGETKVTIASVMMGDA